MPNTNSSRSSWLTIQQPEHFPGDSESRVSIYSGPVPREDTTRSMAISAVNGPLSTRHSARHSISNSNPSNPSRDSNHDRPEPTASLEVYMRDRGIVPSSVSTSPASVYRDNRSDAGRHSSHGEIGLGLPVVHSMLSIVPSATTAVAVIPGYPMLVQTSFSRTNLDSGPFSTGAASWSYGTYTENYIGGFNGGHHNGNSSHSNEHDESFCYHRRGNHDGNRIFFYHKHQPYFEFTNFSRHAVSYEGKMYPTSEHLFQAFKFIDHDPHLAEHIRICSDLPRVALIEAHRLHEKQRSDWREVNVEKMELTLYLKFTQHRQLREKLVSTGNAELVENSDTDSFWGIGPDGRGRNELGKALERLRAYLRGSA